jgi:hypothetical protein
MFSRTRASLWQPTAPTSTAAPPSNLRLFVPVVFHATIKNLRKQIVARNKIIEVAKAQGVDATGWELSNQTLHACEVELRCKRTKTRFNCERTTKDPILDPEQYIVSLQDS